MNARTPPDRPVKVLVSGAFSTGKTTALRLLRAALEEVGLRAVLTVEAARRCPLPMNKSQHADTSTWLLGDIVRQESELSAGSDTDAVSCDVVRCDVVLCDGGPPDVLAHSPADDPAGLRRVSRLCAAWQPTYDLVFWSRPVAEWPVERDDLRVEDDEFRAEIDKSVEDAFRVLGVRPRELPSNAQDRVVVMLDAIRALVPVAGG